MAKGCKKKAPSKAKKSSSSKNHMTKVEKPSKGFNKY